MSTAIVVALYVFIGNSGVISFGQMSFVAVGAFLSGILTIDAQQKSFVLPGLFPILRNTHVGTPLSLLLAALVGGIYALLVGLVLMRLSGLPAGIATFAVLGITYNVFRNWEKIGPGRAGAQLGAGRLDLGADARRADQRRAARTATSAAASGASCARPARIRPRRRRAGSTSIASGSSPSR